MRFGAPDRSAGDAPAVGPEQKEAFARQGQPDPVAGIQLGDRQAFGDRDERALGADIEIEQRVLAQRLDEADRQLQIGARTDVTLHAHVLGPDTERHGTGRRRGNALRQSQREIRRAEARGGVSPAISPATRFIEGEPKKSATKSVTGSE